jgi:hypothetical protein
LDPRDSTHNFGTRYKFHPNTSESATDTAQLNIRINNRAVARSESLTVVLQKFKSFLRRDAVPLGE